MQNITVRAGRGILPKLDAIQSTWSPRVPSREKWFSCRLRFLLCGGGANFPDSRDFWKTRLCKIWLSDIIGGIHLNSTRFKVHGPHESPVGKNDFRVDSGVYYAELGPIFPIFPDSRDFLETRLCKIRPSKQKGGNLPELDWRILANSTNKRLVEIKTRPTSRSFQESVEY